MVSEHQIPQTYIVEGVKKSGVSISANSAADCSVAIGKTGYTAIGCVGYATTHVSGANVNWLSFPRIYVTGTILDGLVRNHNTSNCTADITFYILYRKN